MDQAVGRFGDKRRTVVIRDTASGGELAYAAQQFKPRMFGNGEDFSSRSMIGDIFHGGSHRQIGIALKIAGGNGFLAHMV